MGDKEIGFTINKEYADKYNKWREKEELQKLKDRYGDVDLEASSSSSSESEDEDAEALTPKLEKDWLRAYAAVKTRNPKIYDKSSYFYNSGTSSDSSSEAAGDAGKREAFQKKKKKPMFLKDYERKVIVEKGGHLSDEESSENEEHPTIRKGYYEEQNEILRSLKTAAKDSDTDSEDGDFLTKRKKTKEELQKEEEEYIDWLKGQKEELESDKQVGIELASLKEYWNNPSLSKDEEFLKDFILNKRYLEEQEGIPTYEDIVEDFSEEETQLKKEEDFEHKYNFRFEDPDPEFIKSYPRTVGDSVRRKDTRRVEKRQKVKERKEMEKQKKKEEIKQLKNLKKKEIMDRIEKVKTITGSKELEISTNDIDGDFDPDAHDQLMKKMFTKQYYDEDIDDEKPTWSDDDEMGLEVDDWDNWAGPSEKGGGSQQLFDEEDEQEISYDTDSSDDQNEDTDIESTKKRKRKSKFQTEIEKKKPVFDPKEKTFEEYLDEYYKLDYEDIVANMPCRFKYRQTVANDFGLTADEVLSARERELNQWVSLKRMSQYRTEEEEQLDVKLFHKRGRNVKKKFNVLTSLGEEAQHEKSQAEEHPESKSKKKKKRNKEKIEAEEATESKHATKRKHDNSQSDSGPHSSKKIKKADSQGKHSTDSSVKLGGAPNAMKGFVQTQTVSKHKDISLAKQKILESKKKHLKNNQKQRKKKVFRDQKLKKNKGKKNKQKAGHMSDERLKAYGINPKKFKYRHMSSSKS